MAGQNALTNAEGGHSSGSTCELGCVAKGYRPAGTGGLRVFILLEKTNIRVG